ncbi:translation initiation factor IF-2 [Ancylomarina euxinus]|uniref:Translation initiation factor IF-2 n=1 Tax=Ancylomarina euxinus TaxID=2283627 RepID=A0A425XZ44_9BACT|nr:translation initiation factor IF-2 [Ancylomarina euxinus]MCZ4695637.1 translation initiation factor IF-2 [Ancylomarina euxinus]MUP16059.1 translation initiation factor IF-2 [Ancylomarina euxinus]RRG20303.1 translation initiation factor IF-2 [Ancylomarina euxinus]
MTQVNKNIRLSKLAREFNVGITTIVEFLNKKGIEMDSNPNNKVSGEAYDILAKEYSSDINLKKESEKVNLKSTREKKDPVYLEGSEPVREETVETPKEVEPKSTLKVVGKIDLDAVSKPKKKEEAKVKESKVEEEPVKKDKIPVSEEKIAKAKSKEEAKQPSEAIPEEQSVKMEVPKKEEAKSSDKKEEFKVIGKIDLNAMNQRTRPAKKTKAEKDVERKEKQKTVTPPTTKPVVETKTTPDATTTPPAKPEKKEEEIFKSSTQRLTGPTVIGKIELPVEKKTTQADKDKAKNQRKKRKRIKKDGEKVNVEAQKGVNRPKGTGAGAARAAATGSTSGRPAKDSKFNKLKKKAPVKKEVTEEDVQKQIKDTLARLTSKGGKSKGAKHRREKRDMVSVRQQEIDNKKEAEKNTIKLTEFVTVSELASMMEVTATQIIGTCMGLGLFVSINQRLDAETISVVADEFGFEAEFVSVEIQESIVEEEDKEEDLISRPPIVTVMGHVDHGKTSLLDYVRHANVIEGEAGGITQHIGAYNVKLDDGRRVSFLDTPGHEAFTAMRARGAQVTDIAIIIISADDNVMPQTIEAINHASAAGVPIVFAINKIDKDGADPERIKSELANMNYLVEDWGGKYQCQEISAKNGINIEELLEKVLLEAEMLELKANPNKRAIGSVIESSLDKGRGYVTTLLVQAGTLKVGDILLAGSYTGHVKAMFNERGQKIDTVGPSEPALILGLNGAPQAGDNFNVMESEKEARGIANKREQLQREQGLRTQKHITLAEIGRRIAIGNFQELNVIVKGDVDGSIEALSDSLIKLSTEEIQVNVIHKAVGQISESDVMLATASNAIIVGFQVRPSVGARKIAEKEEIDIRLYSIIYDAIAELKSAMEGMLSPEIKEEIVATVEVTETFEITKVGTIAGCIVRDGKIKRNSKIRLIRDGIVIYSGTLGSLKRFKDDAKEVAKGYECGLNIDKFNDIKIGDMVEAFEEVEVAKKLK